MSLQYEPALEPLHICAVVALELASFLMEWVLTRQKPIHTVEYDLFIKSQLASLN